MPLKDLNIGWIMRWSGEVESEGNEIGDRHVGFGQEAFEAISTALNLAADRVETVASAQLTA